MQISKAMRRDARRCKLEKRGVNTRNVNMIVSCVRVPKGVPRFKEESFMIIGCSVNDFNIVKIKSVTMFVYMLSNQFEFKSKV